MGGKSTAAVRISHTHFADMPHPPGLPGEDPQCIWSIMQHSMHWAAGKNPDTSSTNRERGGGACHCDWHTDLSREEWQEAAEKFSSRRSEKTVMRNRFVKSVTKQSKPVWILRQHTTDLKTKIMHWSVLRFWGFLVSHNMLFQTSVKKYKTHFKVFILLHLIYLCL